MNQNLLNKEIIEKQERLTLKKKLLIFEYKEKFPYLSPEYIADIFELKLESVQRLFNKQYILVKSKINKK